MRKVGNSTNIANLGKDLQSEDCELPEGKNSFTVHTDSAYTVVNTHTLIGTGSGT